MVTVRPALNEADRSQVMGLARFGRRRLALRAFEEELLVSGEKIRRGLLVVKVVPAP